MRLSCLSLFDSRSWIKIDVAGSEASCYRLDCFEDKKKNPRDRIIARCMRATFLIKTSIFGEEGR